jgi:hypothetical protein
MTGQLMREMGLVVLRRFVVVRRIDFESLISTSGDEIFVQF